MSNLKAILALEDGTLFSGQGIGAPGAAAGEVVFNTAMTGYQEILTDPSYTGQLVTLTTSHVGNTGVNEHDIESARPMAAGLIVRDCPRRPSSWRATESLPDYLARHNIVAISDIDTRALTTRLREKGAMNGCILAGESPDPDQALKRARECPAMQGQDLASVISTAEPYVWTQGSIDLNSYVGGPLGPMIAPEGAPTAGQAAKDRHLKNNNAGGTPAIPGTRNPSHHVVCYDFGVKRNILRLLADAGCRVTVVPAKTGAKDALALKPDGIMLSNGPGDPEPCGYAIEAIRELLDREVPLFGICLGHQLLGLALGAKTLKMKFGHHGANHPVKDLESGRVLITSQNHGFAVDETTLPENVTVTHQSLFDGSLQGIRATDRPAFGFQGHPEASPGPHDIRYLFERFVNLMERDQGSGTRDQ